MKYLLVLPAGGGLKTFLCTPFVDSLLESGEVCVWHALPEAAVDPFRQRWGNGVRWEPLPAYHERLAERVARQAKGQAQIHWKYKEDKEILLERVRPTGPWWNRCIGALSSFIGRSSASASRIGRLDRWHEQAAVRNPARKPFHQFVSTFKPDVVFCAYQRAIRAVPPLATARQLEIPTATFIYSWDNLPKGRITVPSQYFFVWSDFMKQELLEYYPSLSPEVIRVVGTPQFEHYSNQTLLRPRVEFLSSLGLNPAQKVICFSGDDVKTSPHDPVYLADLAKRLREFPEANRPQILFRPCPTDRSGRFDWVLKDFPEIKRSVPLWSADQGSDWSQVVPARDDIALLINVVAHCELVVNVGSTMAMDFAVFDKPAVYIAYDPPIQDGNWNIETIYRLPHFKSVHELQPVYWAKSPRDLGEKISRALQCPQEKSSARRAWLRHHVMHPLEEASSRCARALLEISSARGIAKGIGSNSRAPHEGRQPAGGHTSTPLKS